MRPSFSTFAFSAGGRQRTSSLPMCWIAAGAIVGEDADLDQAVGVERGLDLAPHGVGRAVVADRDDGVEVMRLGAFLLALGAGEEEGGHAPIIGAA
jgi:hypothetical protein